MIHFLYKTTRFDGKFYIGIHSTDDIDDGYLGSGKYLLASIKKYGKDTHTREVIKMFDTREEALTEERQIVDAGLVNDRRCMNVSLGGNGGNIGEANGFYGKKHTAEALKKIASKSSRCIGEEERVNTSRRFKGFPLSSEHRLKLSQANVGKSQNHSKEAINKREMAKRRSVEINGIKYASIKDAAAALGTYREKIARMMSKQSNVEGLTYGTS